MTDYGCWYEATPHSVLIKNLMDPNIPKTQMEHAACREIEMLREALAEEHSFKIYKPTPPQHAIPNVRDAELPWVYDQDPSSGNVASMWVTPVKAAPPQRQWVGLTDEDLVDCESEEDVRFVRAIEAKLKEKNGE